ncbi:nucleoside hydrolase, partial [Staphylococcus epidermidis]|uniref:nucleoside hydrolase n=2 Tax=Staphylococcus TaxID=1279 RepID=UPI0030C398FB
MDALPILNESQTPKRANESNYEAYEDIIQKVNASTEKVTLLFTGPLTDLAKAMRHDQSFLSNVEKLVWMGGTFLDKGNVEEPEHDGTA